MQKKYTKVDKNYIVWLTSMAYRKCKFAVILNENKSDRWSQIDKMIIRNWRHRSSSRNFEWLKSIIFSVLYRLLCILHKIELISIEMWIGHTNPHKQELKLAFLFFSFRNKMHTHSFHSSLKRFFVKHVGVDHAWFFN